MAEYKTYGDVVSHPLFAEFVKNTLGLDDVNQVAVLDQNALFYAFRRKIGDLSDEEQEKLAMYQNDEPNDEIKKFASEKLGKKYEDFSDEEKIFAALSYLAHTTAQKNAEQSETHDEPTSTDFNRFNDAERIRSYNSDTNDDGLYDVRLEILIKKGIIKNLKEEDTDTREKVIKLVNKHMENMSSDERNSIENEIFAQMINNEVLFAIMPPKKLAEAYLSYSEQAAKEKDDNKRTALLAEKERIGKRIDELTDMLVRDSHYSNDLFFMDNTNVADAYHGYAEMFSARMNDLPENDPRREKILRGLKSLDGQYSEYLTTWNLQNLTPEKAKDLDKRFEKIDEGLKKVELNDEIAGTVISDNGATLGQLLSNFKYLGEDGSVEPQFIDKDGNKTDTYSPGAKVIKGSKLDRSITLAKQLFIQNNLGSDEELTPEMMKTAISEYLPTVMYITHVKSNIEKGLAEDINQFSNPKYLAEFKNSIGRIDQPMKISHNSFKQAEKSMINDAYSFRDALADKLTSKDNPKDKAEDKNIVHNLCRNLISIDNLRDMRYTKRVTDDPWKNYASEVLQGTVAAAIGTARIRGAMILSSAVAGATTGIAAGTIMLGASAVVPVGLSIKQYISCRNELKKSGKPCGFKDVFKNKNFLASLGTTALTEAAIGCALAPVPGARIAAVALGAAAIGIGITRAAMNDYKKLRTAGKPKWKALGAALFGGAIKAGAAYLVGHEMQALAQDAGMFQETVKVKDAQEEITHEEWRYDADVADKAHHTLENFYGHDNDALNHDLNQVREQLHAMGRDDIPPEVFLRNAIDAGMNTGVDTLNHVQGGPDVHTHGNNTVMTKWWAEEYHIDYDDVKNLAAIKDADGNIHIDDNALKGFDNTKHMVNTNNTVGHMDGVENQTDGVLPKMASYDETTGHNVTDKENPQFFQTYADGDNGLHKETIVDQHASEAVYETREVESPYTEYAYAMEGIRNGGWLHKISPRAGAFLDSVKRKFSRNQTPKDSPDKDNPPAQNKIHIPAQEHHEQPFNEFQEQKKAEPVIIPAESKDKKTVVIPIQKEEDLLLKEYQLVYDDKRVHKSALAEYKKLVLEEYEKATADGKTKADFQGYLQERKDNFKSQLAQNFGVENLDDIKLSEIRKVVNEARDLVFTTRTGASEGDGQSRKTNDITLLKLQEFILAQAPNKSKNVEFTPPSKDAHTK